MNDLTSVQIQILSELNARGGHVYSFLALTGDLGIDYRWGRECLTRLERIGFVTIDRHNRQAMRIVSNRPGLLSLSLNNIHRYRF